MKKSLIVLLFFIGTMTCLAQNINVSDTSKTISKTEESLLNKKPYSYSIYLYDPPFAFPFIGLRYRFLNKKINYPENLSIEVATGYEKSPNWQGPPDIYIHMRGGINAHFSKIGIVTIIYNHIIRQFPSLSGSYITDRRYSIAPAIGIMTSNHLHFFARIGVNIIYKEFRNEGTDFGDFIKLIFLDYGLGYSFNFKKIKK